MMAANNVKVFMKKVEFGTRPPETGAGRTAESVLVQTGLPVRLRNFQSFIVFRPLVQMFVNVLLQTADAVQLLPFAPFFINTMVVGSYSLIFLLQNCVQLSLLGWE
jgi:hypothetical protein